MRFNSFNPKAKEKASAMAVIKSQYKGPLLMGPVSLKFIFTFSPAKSLPKKTRIKMFLGDIEHVKKPDCSNLLKFAEDCLKGIVIYDDSQAVKVYAEKCYAEKDETKIFVIKLGVDDAIENWKE